MKKIWVGTYDQGGYYKCVKRPKRMKVVEPHAVFKLRNVKWKNWGKPNAKAVARYGPDRVKVVLKVWNIRPLGCGESPRV
jgi:hypothetical protein